MRTTDLHIHIFSPSEKNVKNRVIYLTCKCRSVHSLFIASNHVLFFLQPLSAICFKQLLHWVIILTRCLFLFLFLLHLHRLFCIWICFNTYKVKYSHARYRGLGPELMPEYRQLAHSGRLPFLSTSPAVTFPAEERHHPLTSTKLYCCVVTEAHRCEQLAQGCYAALSRWELNPRKFNPLPLFHLKFRYRSNYNNWRFGRTTVYL